MDTKLEPEIEEGNIEYKRKIHNLTNYRLEQLTSQMKWRINEGNGEALYYIGVNDNGTIYGLDHKEFCDTMKNLSIISKKINSNIVDVQKIYVTEDNKEKLYAIVKIKSNLYIANYQNYRIIFLGESQVGKSTLISILSYGQSDDGNGSARLSLFNHKHEIFAGKTSSITLENIGYCEDEFINHTKYNIQDIINKSTKILSLIDIPGNDKYYKTTLNNICNKFPHVILIVINPFDYKMEKIKFFIDICQIFEIRYCFIFTKNDLPDYVKNIKNLINKINKNFNIKIYIFIKSKNNKNIYYHKISNITLDGIDKLQDFLNKIIYESENYSLEVCNLSLYTEKSDTEININDIFQIPNIGPVITGTVLSGNVKINDELKLGPIYKTANSEILWVTITIKSIYRNNIPTLIGETNTLISITFDLDENIIESDIKKDMLLVSDIEKIKSYSIITIKSKINLKIGIILSVFIRNIITTCEVLEINKDNYKLKICKNPIYVKINDNVLLKHHDLYGVGKIVQL